MSVDYNYKKGIDLPAWQWLSPFPAGPSYHGTSNVYDGKRYLYWVIQYGTTAATASTTALYRFDTWNNGWQFLTLVTSGNQGVDIEYDSVRNVLYVIHGVSLTSWQVFNLNTIATTIAGVACPAFALTTMTPVLPATAQVGSSLTMPSDDSVPLVVDTGIATTGGTTTTINSTAETASFGAGMVGLQVRVTSGTQNGQARTISAVSAPNTLVVSTAFAGALAAGDTFTIEQVSGTAIAGGTTTTLPANANVNWTVNNYAAHDVIILSGTGAGQRRRITSNTASVLTLAGAVTGNPRTGPFTTAPDATSVFRIVPSQDFLYYQAGNTTGLYRIDVAQTTGAAWATLGAAPAAMIGGANTFYPSQYAPYSIIAFRASGSSQYYIYNIGLNTWSTPTVFPAGETFNTGASAAMITGKRKLIVAKESATRLYVLDLLTGVYEPAGTMPYAPGAGYDGKRARVVTTPDGAQFLYILRAGGQEFFRVPLEWF